MATKKTETVEPLVFTNSETGKKITVEFNRIIVLQMDADGYSSDFIMEKIHTSPVSTLANVFYYGMLMHQPDTTKEEAIDFFFDNVGISEELITRLAGLYGKTYNEMVNAQRKNSVWTVK